MYWNKVRPTSSFLARKGTSLATSLENCGIREVVRDDEDVVGGREGVEGKPEHETDRYCEFPSQEDAHSVFICHAAGTDTNELPLINVTLWDLVSVIIQELGLEDEHIHEMSMSEIVHFACGQLGVIPSGILKDDAVSAVKQLGLFL